MSSNWWRAILGDKRYRDWFVNTNPTFPDTPEEKAQAAAAKEAQKIRMSRLISDHAAREHMVRILTEGLLLNGLQEAVFEHGLSVELNAARLSSTALQGKIVRPAYVRQRGRDIIPIIAPPGGWKANPEAARKWAEEEAKFVIGDMARRWRPMLYLLDPRQCKILMYNYANTAIYSKDPLLSLGGHLWATVDGSEHKITNAKFWRLSGIVTVGNIYVHLHSHLHVKGERSWPFRRGAMGAETEFQGLIDDLTRENVIGSPGRPHEQGQRFHQVPRAQTNLPPRKSPEGKTWLIIMSGF